MADIGNLTAALAAGLMLQGGAFLKLRPVRVMLRSAISFVLAASLYVNEFHNPTPAHAAIASVAAIGTNTSKAADTSLAITVGAAGVAAGNSVIVAFAMDSATGTVSVADTQGNAYNLDADVNFTANVRTLIFSAHNITALVNTNTITVTYPSVTAKAVSAASFSGLALISTKDTSATATGSSTAPSAGPTAATEIANELVIGAIGVEGDTGDTFTVGTGYSNTNFTRAGTTGAGFASNITINPEYKTVSATGTQTAGATSTNRDWATAVVTYRAKPAVWDSYESTCTTVTNTFSNPGDQVCTKSSGADAFTASIGSVYKLRLFDGGDAAVTCADQTLLPASTLAGSTLLYIINTAGCTGAAAGTWKAVVFQNVTLPATYPSTNALQVSNQVAAVDSFTVNTGAIPELPSPLAAFGAGITAAVLYLFMKRRLAHAEV